MRIPAVLFALLALAPALPAQVATPSPSPAAAAMPHHRLRKNPPLNPAATPAPAANAAPATNAAPANAAAPRTPRNNGPTATQAPGGGNGQVWVNENTHVYHKEGSPLYGRTKHGKYMNEQDAIKAGYHASKGKE